MIILQNEQTLVPFIQLAADALSTIEFNKFEFTIDISEFTYGDAILLIDVACTQKNLKCQYEKLSGNIYKITITKIGT